MTGKHLRILACCFLPLIIAALFFGCAHKAAESTAPAAPSATTDPRPIGPAGSYAIDGVANQPFEERAKKYVFLDYGDQSDKSNQLRTEAMFKEQVLRYRLRGADSTGVNGQASPSAPSTQPSHLSAEDKSQQDSKQASDIARAEGERRHEREMTVADLVRTSQRLIQANDYKKALDVLDQILILDPSNDYAIGVRPLVEDRAIATREQFDRNLDRQINAAEERKIPYDDIMRHPSNWPDISEVREQTLRAEMADAKVLEAAGDIVGATNLASRVAPGEELWVIERRAVPDDAAHADDQPGGGALMAKLPGEHENVPVPLKHTDVKASIAGYIATVDVTQEYHNPYDSKIEAVYVFPLPHNAAVNEFVMTVGERKIRGIIREREEAKQIYEEAKSQGHVASLLTQERPNIFTQSVANIEPGKRIDINIKYFHTLAYVDGWYEYVFPMVVGPRFNPPHVSDGVGAVPRGEHGKSGQSTEVQYLRPNERSGHDISLAVSIDAGVKIEQLDSRNHRVAVKNPNENIANVLLASDDSIPNKDFVLRYKVAGKTTKSALMVQRDKENPNAGYFTLMIYPPDSMNDLPRQPLELVFTLDVSGSMSGEPIAQSKSAIRYALQHMRPDDTFQIIRFAGGATQMAGKPVPATPDNVRKGLNFIESTDAGGGTMMIEGIRSSLSFPRDESRLRFVTFLTDGYIGNESEILGEVHRSLGPSRIFSFGVGSSTNRYLLDHMAKLGNGAVAYLGLNDNADEVMQQFFDRIAHPALTDVKIDWGGLKVTETFPQRTPDLFVGRPVILTGRFNGDIDAARDIRISGTAANERREIVLPVKPDESTRTHAGIASVWARTKIADLGDRATYEPVAELAQQVRNVALEYGLMSAYTAFVAVDSMTRTAGEQGTSIAVPVPVPDGVKYQTTVPE